MKLSNRPMAPGPFLQPMSKYIEGLGAFVSCPLTLFPLKMGAACSMHSLYLAQSSSLRRPSRLQGAGTKAGHGLTSHFHTGPPCHLCRDSLCRVCGTGCKPALLRGLPPMGSLASPGKMGALPADGMALLQMEGDLGLD